MRSLGIACAAAAVIAMQLVVSCTATETPSRPDSSAGATTTSSDEYAESGASVYGILHQEWRHRDGSRIDTDVVSVVRGPSHCGWESAFLLHLGWPLGSSAGDDTQMRQYVRDPSDVLGFGDQLEVQTELPAGAVDTRFRVDDVELWIGPHGGDDAVYLVFRDHVEKWPRSTEIFACA